MLFCFCFCVFYTSLVFFLDSHFVIFLINTIGFEMCSLYNNFFFLLSFNQHSIWVPFRHRWDLYPNWPDLLSHDNNKKLTN